MMEKAMAPHASTLAWRIPWTEEPGRLSPWGLEKLDMTEWLHFHFSLSRIGEGNGNPLQCSCLENPRDGGAWWAAVCGVAQSRTRQKWLSSSSSIHISPPSWASFPYPYSTTVITEHRTEELNFLCYRAASCWLAILHTAVYICQRYSQFLPQSPSPTVYFTVYHL